jgi:hypothetical protein
VIFHFREQAQFIISEVNYYQLADPLPSSPRCQRNNLTRQESISLELWSLWIGWTRDLMQDKVLIKKNLRDQTKVCHLATYYQHFELSVKVICNKEKYIWYKFLKINFGHQSEGNRVFILVHWCRRSNQRWIGFWSVLHVLLIPDLKRAKARSTKLSKTD